MNTTLVRSVTALSLLGGGALLIAPRMTGAFFGLPTESPTFLRVLGVRDLLIGAALAAGAHREGLLARGVSDVFDTALIVREGVRGRSSVVGTIVRAIVGGTSAAVALHAALTREQEQAT
jgi:hypothetical protein